MMDMAIGMATILVHLDAARMLQTWFGSIPEVLRGCCGGAIAAAQLRLLPHCISALLLLGAKQEPRRVFSRAIAAIVP